MYPYWNTCPEYIYHRHCIKRFNRLYDYRINAVSGRSDIGWIEYIFVIYYACIGMHTPENIHISQCHYVISFYYYY